MPKIKLISFSFHFLLSIYLLANLCLHKFVIVVLRIEVMKLVAIATFVLTMSVSISAVQAGGILRNAKSPHLVNSGAHPNNAKMPVATHHFKVHVQGRELSEIMIDVPEGITISDRIVVTDQSNQKIATTVAINDRRINLTFAQPVPLETTLLVAMKNIKKQQNITRLWLYPVYGKTVDVDAELPLGIARVQTY